MKKKMKKTADSSVEDKIYPLPVYKAEDDIYNRKKKEFGYNDQDPGEDLDVPGAELDDLNEVIGEEDEENNYYSLGGDERN